MSEQLNTIETGSICLECLKPLRADDVGRDGYSLCCHYLPGSTSELCTNAQTRSRHHFPRGTNDDSCSRCGIAWLEAIA